MNYWLRTKLKVDESVKKTIVSHIENMFKDFEKIPFDIGIASLWKTKKTVYLDIKTRSQQVREQIADILDKEIVINEQIRLCPCKVERCDVERFKMEKGAVRWEKLEHNGPYFKHLYEPPTERLSAKLIYGGKEYALTPEEEEVASFYAKRIITEEKSTKKYLDKKQFNDNFFNDFKLYFTAQHAKIFTDFKKFDFSNFVIRIKQLKEEKEREKEEKEKDEQKEKEDRILKLERKLNFCFAYVNDVKKEIRNSAVELPGIYVGSGNVMTNKGKIKHIYNPEDVTINVSQGCIPVPPKGHSWGEVVHNQNANWTARYKDKTTGKYKYILLSETGDLLKFEKARKLNRHIEVVDKRIHDLLNSRNVKEQQIGCALYLIKEYGIRVGNECEDDCDSDEKVVGATTLMVQNVTCRKNKYIDLSFKGKDSVSYDNTLTVSPKVYEHISSFTKHKKGHENVFHEINSNDVNKYLKSIDKDFSAKVFRTRLASSIMFDELKYDYEDESDEQKIADFNHANRLVAVKLNHKKGLTDAVKERLKKDQEQIDALKEKYDDEKDEKKKKKLEADIESKEMKLSERDKSKEIALDTSKKNYIDPRIVKVWAERVDVKLDKIYSKTHLKHFSWALDTDDSWDYDETELDPMVGEELCPE